MTALASETGGWTALQEILNGPAEPQTGSGPTSPGPDPDMPRRRRTDGEAVAVAGLPGRWWPARPCCGETVRQLPCVLPPEHRGTHLPKPSRAR